MTWQLDVGSYLQAVGIDQPLAVKGGRAGWVRDAEGWLVRRDPRGWNSRTRVLGAELKLQAA